MNRVQARLIAYIVDHAADHEEFKFYIKDKTHEELARMMFANFRGSGASAKGLRLTSLGLTIMKAFFHSFEVPAYRQGKCPTANELLYLDKKASLPYHIDSQGEIVLFDTKLGLKLKLVDGDISALIDAEGR